MVWSLLVLLLASGPLLELDDELLVVPLDERPDEVELFEFAASTVEFDRWPATCWSLPILSGSDSELHWYEFVRTNAATTSPIAIVRKKAILVAFSPPLRLLR